jgi:DNA invertase Pin-like site-specific DNA recombinase
MICAVYARKSTEQNGLADESKSVARQVEHARAYAGRKGWLVSQEHLFVDDGVSGALFGASRPALARLLAALKPRAAFNVLIMSEESRLGREQIETAYTLKQITDAGVRVFFYLEDRERTLDSAMDKVMLSLTNFASEMEREKARQRTHDALARKARQGYVTGGCVFGYRNVPILDGGRRVRVERVIHEQEADIVRRIFGMAAAGKGFKRIAATLNEEGALAPTPRRTGRPRGWAPSSVRAIIYRGLYRGAIVWNQRQKVIRQGAKKLRRRAESDWLRVDAPALRIVAEDLWRAAHERVDASRTLYRRSANGGRSPGRPTNGLESPYLLTGLLSCGSCGGSMFVHSHDHRHHRRFYYACMVYHLRGRGICKNNLESPMPDTDAAVLAAVERDLLRVQVLVTALAKALDMLRPTANARMATRALFAETWLSSTSRSVVSPPRSRPVAIYRRSWPHCRIASSAERGCARNSLPSIALVATRRSTIVRCWRPFANRSGTGRASCARKCRTRGRRYARSSPAGSC